ncbi:helix-turn-helix transcriptional regulator [Mycolicibacterium stellerae]|uniref:helix-turn-helix transcriptional regulator n=1 Tax=Mycolicibacterium stellerae TaxID=2358193 RepID=UPI001F418493|nr:hypothetical protein [Mycolicibacterium stellerae]
MDTAAKVLVSIPEARQLLGGIGHTTVYELVKRGEAREGQYRSPRLHHFGIT